MQPVLGLQTFLRHAGSYHFGEAVDVHGLYVEAAFDFLAHRVCPGLGAEDTDLERTRARVEALPCELVQDRQHVTRRHHNYFGFEVLDRLHLPLGHAPGHRDHRASEPLRPGVRAQSSGEQPIPIRVVHFHPGTCARGEKRSRDDAGPHVEVGPRLGDDVGFARGAGRAVQARDLVLGNGEEAERIGGPEIRLGREGKLRQIWQILEI